MCAVCTAKLSVQTPAAHLSAFRGMDLLPNYQGVEHTRRTVFIAQALKARQEALRFHNLPQETTPNSEVMHSIFVSLREQLVAQHDAQRPTENRRQRLQRIRVAFSAYVFQALTASHSYVEFNKQAFWESIRTNSISEADRDNVRRYEDAQRRTNSVITTKIIKLCVCIAKAWARSSASRGSLAENMNSAGQPAKSTKLVDARCEL